MLLSDSLFGIDSRTQEEHSISLKDAIGFQCVSPEDRGNLYKWANDLAAENIKLSLCRDRKCIDAIIRESKIKHPDWYETGE